MLVYLCYIAINIFYIGFNDLFFHKASLKAVDLALINLILAFANLYLSFLADLFKLNLATYHRFHYTLGTMLYCLLSFYIITMIASRTPFPLD